MTERDRWKQLVDASPDGFLAFDRDCRYTAWNPAMERISGMAAADVIGRIAWEVFPFLRDEGEDEFFRAALAGEVRHTPHRAYRIPETNRVGWFRGEYAPVHDADGNVIGGMAVIRETTDTYRADQTLRMQGLVLDSMAEGVSVANEAGFIVYTNPAEDRMFGYEPGELIGQHVSVQNAYPPEENERIVGDVIARLKADGVWVGEWQNVRKDGTRFVTRSRITALDLDGAPHWVCVQEDVTAASRMEAERAGLARQLGFLAAAGKELASSLDATRTLETVAHMAVPTVADWCFVERLDADGAVRLVAVGHTDRALEQFAHEVLERYPIDLNAPFGTGKVIRTGEAELTPRISPEVFEMVAHDAAHLEILRRVGFVSSITVPLRAHGRVIGALTFAQAASNRHFSEADLPFVEEVAARAALALENARLFEESQDANRAKSDFMSALSHEFRTPLNAIIGYSDLLQAGVPEVVSTPVHAQIERIGLSARHLLSLIEEILTFSRLEAGRERLRLESGDVHSLVAESRAIVEPLARAKGLSLTVREPDHAIEIVSDLRKVRQVLINLLDNAVKFTQQGGIELDARLVEDSMVFEVRDTGIGIAPEHHARVFDPFWQADQSNTRTAHGTGLGLAVSQGLARALGGDVTLASEPGRGSTFTFHLPRVAQNTD